MPEQVELNRVEKNHCLKRQAKKKKSGWKCQINSIPLRKPLFFPFAYCLSLYSCIYTRQCSSGAHGNNLFSGQTGCTSKSLITDTLDRQTFQISATSSPSHRDFSLPFLLSLPPVLGTPFPCSQN